MHRVEKARTSSSRSGATALPCSDRLPRDTDIPELTIATGKAPVTGAIPLADTNRVLLEATELEVAEALGRPLAPAAEPQIRSGSTPSASSAWRAASCSAAFFVEPRPIPSCAPAMCAAHTKRRSCGGPSTSSTV